MTTTTTTVGRSEDRADFDLPQGVTLLHGIAYLERRGAAAKADRVREELTPGLETLVVEGKVRRTGRPAFAVATRKITLPVDEDVRYTTDEAARILGVSRSTVRRHLEPGRTPGGHRRYTPADIETLRSMMGQGS